MNAYKGIPSSIVEFNKYCSNYKIKYTEKLCQDALVDLIKTANTKVIEKKYGALIINCFTQNDLEKFAR